MRAVRDTVTGYWGYTLPAMPGVPGQSILVSPADAPGAGGPSTLARPVLITEEFSQTGGPVLIAEEFSHISGPVPLPEKVSHTGGPVSVPQGPAVTTTPVADDLDFNDIILVFPGESGLKPLYIMLRDRRNMPGTVSGKGQRVEGNWLSGASEDEGAAIPSQIADKLRGKSYSSFDAFRKALWTEVSKDPELLKQFDPNSLDTMKKGRAPYARKQDRVGKRVKIELHHKQGIAKGGDVYDVDNLNAVTPKNHINIHKGN